MGRKSRILVNSEYSQLTSGYSRVAKEILTRLHNKGKYEVAEFAAYASPDDPNIHKLPWKVYPILPSTSNQDELNEYNSHPHNPSGRHKFASVALEFEPDVVLTYRDYWYDHHVHTCPYRRFYNIIWINPVDSLPQAPEWIDDVIDSEACFTYTDFGHNVLQAQCPNTQNLFGPFRLSADTKSFHPIFNKNKIKEHFNFEDDSLIVGFVARNQYRKLFDEIFRAFTLFLEKAPSDLASRVYLYIHSGWPDIHLKFPQILNEYGISNKVLFTYFCKQCHNIFPSVYADMTCVCKYCNGPASLPRPSDNALDESKLNIIYNFFDLYIANFTNEGIGLPPLEAMCCAVPTMITNFSGAEDLVKLCGAIPLEPLELRREAELHRLLAVPNNVDLAGKLVEVLSLPNMIRKKIGYEQYLKATQIFNWDNEVLKLENCIDRLPQKNWANPINNLIQPDVKIPENLTPNQYIWWLYHKIEGRPDLFNRFEGLQKIHNLMMGYSGQKPNFGPYNKQIALTEAISNSKYNNDLELKRLKKFKSV